MSSFLPEAALSPEAFETVYQAGSDAVYALVGGWVRIIREHPRQREEDLRDPAEVQARLQALEARSSKDSHNSSKPPSSDGFSRTPKSLQAKTDRKPGGQPGHPGKTLQMSETPDERVMHAAEQCPGCGEDLRQGEAEIVD